MTTGSRRVALVLGAALILGAILAPPAPAQQATETTISYAADASSAGLYVAITPPGDTEPAAAIAGASVEGTLSSEGPTSSGSADALAPLGQTPVRAESSAPPDETDTASSPIPAVDVPGLATIGALQGEASSTSKLMNDLPLTDNDASFSGAAIDLSVLDLGPLGSVGGEVSIAPVTTSADAVAVADTEVIASADSSGVTMGADLDISLLSELCANLPPGPLQDACNSVADQGGAAILNVSLGVSAVECTWDGDAADCDGFGAVAVIELLGQEPVTVSPGETVTIPEDGPFLARVSLGDFSEEVTSDPDSASAIATGVSVELLGADPALPGLITLQLGQSTAAVSGDVETAQVLPRTGGPVLPILFGGAALVAGGLGLRRFVKRR